VFPHQANGSILESDNTSIGSELIGQQFSQPEYFWGRLSATSPVPYNAASSSGSNFGPLHPQLMKNAEKRIAQLKRYDPALRSIPVDLATSSGSGLDPHISLAAAEAQVRRVAKARRTTENEVRDAVRRCTSGRQLGVLGEARVNVLRLNLALDQIGRK
jgi:K+-transporting ATPase ATPase C chain